MAFKSFSATFRQSILAAGALTLAFCMILLAPATRSQQQPMDMDHQGHEGMSMPMDQPADAAAQARLQAKLLADKRESEFNHHLAGFNSLSRLSASNLACRRAKLLADKRESEFNHHLAGFFVI